MRRIAFIAANEGVPWGGSEYLWSGAAERLARRGVEVHVSVKKWGLKVRPVEDLEMAGCRIFRRPAPTFGERVKRRLLLGGKYEQHHVGKIGAGADLIVVSQGGNLDGAEWMEAARRLGMRYAVIAQSAAEHVWPLDGIGELDRDYEGASAAYFVSEANLALTRRQLATPIRRGRVVRNPFNVKYEARPEWPGDETEELRLACVGRLEPMQKCQDLLIEVLNRPRWRERKIRLSLVGSGPQERALRRRCGELGLSSVEFAGQVSDIEKVWSAHQALVLPSRYEGMPLALVEAMICGRAAIVTDVGGNCELVRNNVNGFVAKAATADFVDEAMNRAWENRGRLREMGEAAARDVRAAVPADPVGEFVRELEALAAVSGQAEREKYESRSAGAVR